MIDNHRVIAIVPARGGSKGLPGKNIKPFCGKPLIGWSIEAGRASRYIDEIMVTTDSEEVARVAREFGARVPFMRPAALAADTSTSIDVVKHALDFYTDELGQRFDLIVLLEPTSPLRTAEDVDGALRMLLDRPDAKAVVGVAKTESQNPAFLVKRDDSDFLVGYEDPGMKPLRRQEIKDVFYLEGSVYVSWIDALRAENSFYHRRTLGYEFPKWKALEIDDVYDFVMAEAIMEKIRSGTLPP